jgi:FecR protein
MSISLLRTMFGAALLAALFVTTVPAAAEDLAAIDPNADVTAVPGWRVSGLSGDVSARLGSAPFERLSIGDLVPVGSDIRTAHGAVVFLSRRGDRIVIQPDTELHIAEPQAGGLLTQLFQSFGNVFYDVEPRSSRSFGVKSPYMAAVVKGTRFLVTVDRDLNSVRVDEGRVLVASNDGESVLVGAGNVATVKRSGEGGVQMTDSAIVMPPVIAPKPVGITANEAAPASGAESQAAGAAGGSSAGGTVGGATKAAGGVVGGAVDAVGGVVGGAVDAVGGVVGGVTNTAGNLVGGVGKAVGGLLGGGRD